MRPAPSSAHAARRAPLRHPERRRKRSSQPVARPEVTATALFRSAAIFVVVARPEVAPAAPFRSAAIFVEEANYVEGSGARGRARALRRSGRGENEMLRVAGRRLALGPAGTQASRGAREAALWCPSVSRSPPGPGFPGSRVRTGPGRRSSCGSAGTSCLDIVMKEKKKDSWICCGVFDFFKKVLMFSYKIQCG